MAVAERLSTFAGDEAGFRTWLFTIAHHRMTDHRRKGARRRTSSQPPEYFDAHVDANSRHHGDLLPTLDDRDAADNAIALLTRELPSEQAQIIALRVLGDLSVSEVAEILGKRPGAVRVAQHRALRKLATTLTSDQVRAVLGS